MNFSNFQIPRAAKEIIETLQHNGFEAWIVGGAVRTFLLGKPTTDWDITTNALPKEIQSLFTHTIETGAAFGTINVIIDSLDIQVTTYRKEGTYQNHRKPTNVSYCNDLVEDLKRRDFTMNSIAYDPIARRIEDPFNGIEDIKSSWIRAVGDPKSRFEEDALRILRALRFQSQLGFVIEPETLVAMENKSHLIRELSKERIREEFSKWILGDYFNMTRDIFSKLPFEEILTNKPGDKFGHFWDHISTIKPDLIFRLSAFFDVYFMDLPHELKIANCLKSLRLLKFSQKQVSKVIQFIRFLSEDLVQESDIQNPNWIRNALKIGFEPTIDLLHWKMQQKRYKLPYLKAKKTLEEWIDSSFEKKVQPLAINGDHVMKTLGIQPGPDIHKILQDAENWVFEDPNRNTEEALLEFLRQYR